MAKELIEQDNIEGLKAYLQNERYYGEPSIIERLPNTAEDEQMNESMDRHVTTERTFNTPLLLIAIKNKSYGCIEFLLSLNGVKHKLNEGSHTSISSKTYDVRYGHNKLDSSEYKTIVHETIFDAVNSANDLRIYQFIFNYICGTPNGYRQYRDFIKQHLRRCSLERFNAKDFDLRPSEPLPEGFASRTEFKLFLTSKNVDLSTVLIDETDYLNAMKTVV